MGYWCTLHLFNDKKFYNEIVPLLKGESGDLTNSCLDFLKLYKTGGINHLSTQSLNVLIEQTIQKIISISNSLNKSFKDNREYQKLQSYDDKRFFLNNLNGYYEFYTFFEYIVFNTCSDFFPHLPLGKGGISKNFQIEIKTLSYSIMTELDSWNNFLCGDLMGVTNWISHEDVELLYLDKENLCFMDNQRAEGFLTLLEVAQKNQLGLIMGVDMRESTLELLPINKLIKPEIWTNINTNGLLWRL